MLAADLDVLEQQARDARSLTVPDAYYTVLVPGDALLELVRIAQQLEQLRALPAFPMLVATLCSDWEDWAHNEDAELEDFPGEAKTRREAYEQLLLMLRETPPC